MPELKAAPAGELAAVRDRDRTYGLAADALAEGYRLAEQQHFDRLAAISRHFGSRGNPRGNPNAQHAVDFLASLGFTLAADPPTPQPAPLTTAEISYNGIVTRRPVNADGKVIDGPKFDDPPRGTFTGSAADFQAAKIIATMTPAEVAKMKAEAPAEPRPEVRAATDKFVLIQPGWDKTRH